jgi:hypothetical protein
MQMAQGCTIAVAFLHGADPRRYESLWSDLAYQQTRGNDQYPSDLTLSYDMLDPQIEHNHIQTLNIKMDLLQQVFQIYLLTLEHILLTKPPQGVQQQQQPTNQNQLLEQMAQHMKQRLVLIVTEKSTMQLTALQLYLCCSMCPLYNMQLY